jgi:hypothetical protein
MSDCKSRMSSKNTKTNFLNCLLKTWFMHDWKCGWCIGQPERHHQELKVPIVAPESSLRDVLIPHPDLVVPRAQVNLREVLGSSKLIHQLINAWDGVPSSSVSSC